MNKVLGSGVCPRHEGFRKRRTTYSENTWRGACLKSFNRDTVRGLGLHDATGCPCEWCGIHVDGEHSSRQESIQIMEIASIGTGILGLAGEISLPGFFSACHSLFKRRHGSPRIVHSGMLPAGITEVVPFLLFSDRCTERARSANRMTTADVSTVL